LSKTQYQVCHKIAGQSVPMYRLQKEIQQQKSRKQEQPKRRTAPKLSTRSHALQSWIEVPLSLLHLSFLPHTKSEEHDPPLPFPDGVNLIFSKSKFLYIQITNKYYIIRI